MADVPKRPNILLFNPDQWRADVMGHFGNPAAVTPTLDGFAETDATSFSNAFCQNTVCTPSRCSFMTGWYPHVRGHRTMHHMLRPDEPMILKTLKEEGYFVWWGGKNDVVPAQNSFDAYCDLKYTPPDTVLRPLQPSLHQADAWRGDPDGDNYFSFYAGRVPIPQGDNVYFDRDWANVEGAIDFINNPPSSQPFCIYLPLTYPHPPYGVEEPWHGMIDRAALPPRIPTPESWVDKPSILSRLAQGQRLEGWTEDRWNELRATYYGMCARVDFQFGKVLEALRLSGMYDDTAIFFFSDHGDFTGDYGLVEKTQNTFEDVLTRVPFLIKPPSWLPVTPGVSDALIELVDLPATIEALAGIQPRHDHFGCSLLPLVAGETLEHRETVFCEGGRRHYETQAMEHESNSAGTDGLYSPRLNWQVQEGPEHTKALMCRSKHYKYVMRLYETDELYDLSSDPGEEKNRIEDPVLSSVLKDLRGRTTRFLLETADVVPYETDLRG